MVLASKEWSLLSRIGLPESLLKKEKITVNPVSIAKGEWIFKSGDPCQYFLIVTSGQVRVDITIRSGREIILYRAKEEETCIMTISALLNDENYYARGFAETDVSAIAISVSDFNQALTVSSTFAHYILTNYSQRISDLILLLDRVASKDILYELSCLLLAQRDKNNRVYLKQDTIAKEIGTAREVISRKLSLLEQQGVLQTQRGKIQLLDIPYLEQLIAV